MCSQESGRDETAKLGTEVLASLPFELYEECETLLTTRKDIFRYSETVTLETAETKRTHLRQQKGLVTSKDRSMSEPEAGNVPVWFRQSHAAAARSSSDVEITSQNLVCGCEPSVTGSLLPSSRSGFWDIRTRDPPCIANWLCLHLCIVVALGEGRRRTC